MQVTKSASWGGFSFQEELFFKGEALMYMEKAGQAGHVVSVSRLGELVSKIEDAAKPAPSAKVFSIFHARAAVIAASRNYPEFRVWAGDMRGRNFVVTIWENWVADGDKHEHLVNIFIPAGMIVS